jgi:hypothetical protein
MSAEMQALSTPLRLYIGRTLRYVISYRDQCTRLHSLLALGLLLCAAFNSYNMCGSWQEYTQMHAIKWLVKVWHVLTFWHSIHETSVLKSMPKLV